MSKKKKWLIAIAAICLVLLAAGAVVYKLSRHKAQYTVTELRLFDFGSKYYLGGERPLLFDPYYFISHDGSHITMALDVTGGGQTVLWDDQIGPTYDVVDGLTLSPDGQRYAYIACTNEKMSSVIDGVEGKQYDRIMPCNNANNYDVQYGASAWFNADSKHVAYVANEGDAKFVVYDGTELEKYSGKYCEVDKLCFSLDGKNLTYEACVAKGPGFYIRNGKRCGDRAFSGSPVYTPDAKPIIYDFIGDKLHTFVVDEIERKEYPSSTTMTLTISPDGKHYAYKSKDAPDNKEVAAFWDEKKGPPFDEISRFQFSPDSQHLMYVAKKGDKSYVVMDNKDILGGYNHVFSYNTLNRHGKSDAYMFSPFIFSPDGKHYAYAATMNNGATIVRDGLQGKMYESVKPLSESVPVDDQTSSNQRYSIYLSSRPIFSPDNQHLAYIARDGSGKFVVLDNEELRKGFDDVSWPTFSPDSKHLAYVAGQYIGKAEKLINKFTNTVQQESFKFIVIDEQAGPAYSWVSAPAFRADGTLVYYAIQDNVLYRVTKKP